MRIKTVIPKKKIRFSTLIFNSKIKHHTGYKNEVKGLKKPKDEKGVVIKTVQQDKNLTKEFDIF